MTDSAGDPSDAHVVRGERSVAIVDGVHSTQTRVSSLLAAALMIALGIAALTWYYAHALTRPGRTRQAAQSAAVNRAQGEMPLPPLGHVELPPLARAPTGSPVPQGDVASVTAMPPPADVPLDESRTSGPSRSLAGTTSSVAAPPRTQHEGSLERRLSGMVFARTSTATAVEGTSPANSVHADQAPELATTATLAQQPRDSGVGELAVRLRPEATPAAPALLLPSAHFVIPKGAFIDCTLETAIDSTLPGMTTCITAADTFGADGKVVLLERGTKLVGETNGRVLQGQARVFVLWTQARTPSGVVVQLDSPGTDELGRAGLPGEVQRHFWERYGAAMLVSLVDGAIQAGVQAASHPGGTVVYSPSAAQDVLTEIFRDTLQIRPTIVKHNGDRIQVLVARDLDFRSVYELRAAG